MLPENRFAPTAAYHPHPTAAQSAVSSREWPSLTIYRDGLANLNGLATELLRQASSVALVAPAATKPGRLGKAWQLHGEGPLALIGRNDRGLLRFRALAAATALFADLSAEVKTLSFALTPEPGQPSRWRLLPL